MKPFIPVDWLERAAWFRGLVVYAREIPDREPRTVPVSPQSKLEKCKLPLSFRIRPAA